MLTSGTDYPRPPVPPGTVLTSGTDCLVPLAHCVPSSHCPLVTLRHDVLRSGTDYPRPPVPLSASACQNSTTGTLFSITTPRWRTFDTYPPKECLQKWTNGTLDSPHGSLWLTFDGHDPGVLRIITYTFGSYSTC